MKDSPGNIRVAHQLSSRFHFVYAVRRLLVSHDFTFASIEKGRVTLYYNVYVHYTHAISIIYFNNAINIDLFLLLLFIIFPFMLIVDGSCERNWKKMKFLIEIRRYYIITFIDLNTRHPMTSLLTFSTQTNFTCYTLYFTKF